MELDADSINDSLLNELDEALEEFSNEIEKVLQEAGHYNFDATDANEIATKAGIGPYTLAGQMEDGEFNWTEEDITKDESTETGDYIFDITDPSEIVVTNTGAGTYTVAVETENGADDGTTKSKTVKSGGKSRDSPHDDKLVAGDDCTFDVTDPNEIVMADTSTGTCAAIAETRGTTEEGLTKNEPAKIRGEAKNESNGIVGCDDDSVPITVKERTEKHEHPYLSILDNFTPPSFLLTATNGDEYKPITKTPLLLIESEYSLRNVIDDLKKQNEIAIGVLYESLYKYKPQVSFIMICTSSSDYMIDAVSLRKHMSLLGDIFVNPEIVKILYTIPGTLRHLQNDLNLYFVNMFVLKDALIALKMKSKLHVILRKRFGISSVGAGGRLISFLVRPLPSYWRKYLQLNTHYLIHMYHDTKTKLILVRDGSLYRNLLTKWNNDCKVVYGNPHEGEVKTIADSFNNRYVCQLDVLETLYKWRTDASKRFGMDPVKILDNDSLIKLVVYLPANEQFVRELCTLPNPDKIIDEITKTIVSVKSKHPIKLNEQLSEVFKIFGDKDDRNVSKKRKRDKDLDMAAKLFKSSKPKPLKVWADSKPLKKSEQIHFPDPSVIQIIPKQLTGQTPNPAKLLQSLNLLNAPKVQNADSVVQTSCGPGSISNQSNNLFLKQLTDWAHQARLLPSLTSLNATNSLNMDGPGGLGGEQSSYGRFSPPSEMQQRQSGRFSPPSHHSLSNSGFDNRIFRNKTPLGDLINMEGVPTDPGSNQTSYGPGSFFSQPINQPIGQTANQTKPILSLMSLSVMNSVGGNQPNHPSISNRFSNRIENQVAQYGSDQDLANDGYRFRLPREIGQPESGRFSSPQSLNSSSSYFDNIIFRSNSSLEDGLEEGVPFWEPPPPRIFNVPEIISGSRISFEPPDGSSSNQGFPKNQFRGRLRFRKRKGSRR